MKRSLMQIYVKESAEAVETYCRAFDASIGADFRNPDGSCCHVELNAYGQILAISEAPADLSVGNGMQFCFHFEANEADKVDRAYEILKENARIICPIGECSYSRRMFSLIDRFGVYWCLFS